MLRSQAQELYRERFRYLNFDPREEWEAGDYPVKVELVKVYCLHSRRNEWINWSGDTENVRRSNVVFDLSLSTVRDIAEILRTSGTSFGIDETAALCVIGRQSAVLPTTIFTETPKLDIADIAVNSLEEIFLAVRRQKWTAVAIYNGDLKKLRPITEAEVFFSHQSQSSGGKYKLGWSLTQRNIVLDNLLLQREFVKKRLVNDS